MEYKYVVLIVEDDTNVSNLIKQVLLLHNYNVITAFTGTEALSLISSHCPDVILLDLGLPDMDGTVIIKKVRTWSSVPILIISARNQESDKVNGLDCGADDFITKPFGTKELLARIRTSIRHNINSCSDVTSKCTNYHVQGLSINYESHIVTVNDNVIHLTPIEYKILTYLAQNSGKVLTYTTIMKHIWGPYTDDNNKILRVNMANIRRKIEENPGDPKYIFTEIGVGYRMLES